MPLAPVPRARLQASLACVVTLVLWRWRGGPLPATAAAIAAVLALLAWGSPRAYAPVQRVLDRGVHLFLAGLTWLLLGVVWLLVFTPLRALRALAGRESLARSFDRDAATYLQAPPPAAPFDRQF